MAFVLTQNDPFAAVRRDFEQNLGLARSTRAAAATVLAGEDEFQLQLEVPGLTEDQIHVQFEDGQLIVEAAVESAANADAADDRFRVLYDDRPTRRFRRVFQLEDSVDPDHIEAELDLGVLTLRLRKREELKPRRIEVRPAASRVTEGKSGD